jgi:maltose alpha-D-glucosyltransferase/alpha-amylase
MTAGYLRGLADDFARNAQEVLELLNGRTKLLPQSVAATAHEVLSGGSGLIRRFRSLERVAPGSLRIRCHGDYHLGQVLSVEGDDFILLDFEGEPLRPMAERRDKYSGLKDVAGMLRSFGYAAHSAFMELVAERPEMTAVREPWVRAWEAWIPAAFLATYLEGVSDTGLVPADPVDLQLLLDAYVLDKAFYELGYELNNRPDWVGIPLEGIRAVAVQKQNEDKENL